MFSGYNNYTVDLECQIPIMQLDNDAVKKFNLYTTFFLTVVLKLYLCQSTGPDIDLSDDHFPSTMKTSEESHTIQEVMTYLSGKRYA